MAISRNYFGAVGSEFPNLSNNKRLLRRTQHSPVEGPAAERGSVWRRDWVLHCQIIIPMWTHEGRPSSPSSNYTEVRLISEGAVKYPLNKINTALQLWQKVKGLLWQNKTFKFYIFCRFMIIWICFVTFGQCVCLYYIICKSYQKFPQVVKDGAQALFVIDCLYESHIPILDIFVCMCGMEWMK